VSKLAELDLSFSKLDCKVVTIPDDFSIRTTSLRTVCESEKSQQRTTLEEQLAKTCEEP
jgi:hypothetical protein